MSSFIAEAQVRVVPVIDPKALALMKTQLATQLGTASAGLGKVTSSGTAASGATAALGRTAQTTTGKLVGLGSATGRLDAALLGLRTAAGSAAVIGLSAGALAAIALGKAFRTLLIDTARFQQELSTFRAVTGATAVEMQAVSEAASRLGADIRLPAVSAADAAVAMTELSKAGLSVQDSIAGAEGVLQLATAAQISNAEAAQLAANALNAFGLGGDQAVRVADDLANAANAAQGSISDFGLALRQSSAVARQVGLSLEDTTAILSLFAKNGLSGSDAGTSLRVALIRLVAPTKKAGEEIQKLGLHIRDAQGNLRPDVFAQFGEATRDLAPAARDAAAALIFGQDAIRAVSIGAREGRAGLRLMQFQIDQTGTAAEVAAARTQGLAGSFSALQSSAQTFGITIGSVIQGPLQNLTSTLAGAFELANNVAKGLEALGKVKISDIVIPIRVTINGKEIGGGTDLGDVFGKIFEFSLFGGQGPFGQVGKQIKRLNADIEQITTPKSVLELRKRIAELNEELKGLQAARVELGFAEKLGAAEGPADELTRRINKLKKEINALNAEAKGIPASMADHLRASADALRDLSIAHPELNLQGLIDSLVRQANIAQHTEGNINRLRDEYGNLGGAAKKAADGVDTLTRSIRANANESQRSANQTAAAILKLQTEGGTSQQIIAAARADIAKQRQVIAKAKEGGIQPGEATTIRKAREQIAADQAIIEQEQNKITAAAKDRADRIATARDKADQAILDAVTGKKTAAQTAAQRRFAGKVSAAESALAAAQDTKRVTDDIKAYQLLIRINIQAIRIIKKYVKDFDARTAAVKQLTEANKGYTREIQKLQAEQRTATEAAAQSARDARQTHLEALLSIAQTTQTTTDDRRRLNALIAFDKAQIARILAIRKRRRLTQEEKAQLDAYRVDLAQRNQALRDLTDQTNKDKTAAQKLQEAQFAFLQTLTGFTANLIGNLIPGGLTGGLVGGAASGGGGGGVPTVPSNVPSVESRARSPFEHGIGRPPRAAGAPAPASAGQSERQIDWLHRIWSELHKLNRSSDHPEAKHQRKVGTAIMDYEHGHGGM